MANDGGSKVAVSISAAVFFAAIGGNADATIDNPLGPSPFEHAVIVATAVSSAADIAIDNSMTGETVIGPGLDSVASAGYITLPYRVK